MKRKKNDQKQHSRLRTLIGVLRKRDVIHGMTPNKLRMVLEDMGPTYIKLGQIMSMRSDILPESYCNELQELRAQVSPVEFRVVKKMMENEWGRPISKLFEQMDETPLGSASIAQVYRATLKGDGRAVVVKVQRPGIFDMMAQDVKLIHKVIRLMNFTGFHMDALDFGAVVDEMWAVAQQEMNFLLEAEHINRFARLNNGIHYVGCPYVVHSLTTARILVMEQINGFHIDEPDLLRRAGYSMDEIGLKLAENYCKQVLDDAFFHADPHPGNIRIQDGKIVFLDLGMMGTLSERDRMLMRNAVSALTRQDVHRLKDVVLTLGEPQEKVNSSALYSDLNLMVRKYLSADIQDIDLGKLVTELLDLAGKHHIRMPSAITMLARGLITLEGVLNACCPNVNMLQILSSHLAGERMQSLDLRKEAQKLAIDGYAMLRHGMEIPVSLASLMKMAKAGELKANLEIVGSDEPLRKVDGMVTRVIVCIFAASLLLGSSIICTTQMEPHLFGIPLIGAAGFLVAVVMEIWLTIDTVFGKRRKRRK